MSFELELKIAKEVGQKQLAIASSKLGLFLTAFFFIAERVSNDPESAVIIGLGSRILEVAFAVPVAVSFLASSTSFKRAESSGHYLQWMASTFWRLTIMAPLVFLGVGITLGLLPILLPGRKQEVKGLTTILGSGLLLWLPIWYLLEGTVTAWLLKTLEKKWWCNSRKIMLAGEVARFAVTLTYAYLKFSKLGKRTGQDYNNYVVLMILRSISYALIGMMGFCYQHGEKVFAQGPPNAELAFRDALIDIHEGGTTLFSVLADTIAKFFIQVVLFGQFFKGTSGQENLAALGAFDFGQVFVIMIASLPLQLAAQFSVQATGNIEADVKHYRALRKVVMLNHTLCCLAVFLLVMPNFTREWLAHRFSENQDNPAIADLSNWGLAIATNWVWGINNIFEGLGKGLEANKKPYAVINVACNTLWFAGCWYWFSKSDEPNIQQYLTVILGSFTLSAIAAAIVNFRTDEGQALTNLFEKKQAITASPRLTSDLRLPTSVL